MNRREIIIIVAIVNVVLLAVLFTTAQRLEELPPQIVTMAPTTKETPPASPIAIRTAAPAAAASVVSDVAVDEVDSVLRDFAAAVAASQQRQGNTAPQNTSSATPPSTPQALAADTSTASAYHEVTVKRGDFLERIARQQNTTIEAIKQTNHLASDHLKVGQVLRIPVATPKAETSSTALAATPPSTERTAAAATEAQQMYRVKSGDSPWKIAKQFHVDVEELLRLNKLDEDSARNLKPGDTIRVQ